MHTLNAIHIHQMVDAIRLEHEREQARREMLAGLPRCSFVARSRRLIGASFIGVGKLIQGRSQAEQAIELSCSS
jgi:hypothetical protein